MGSAIPGRTGPTRGAGEYGRPRQTFVTGIRYRPRSGHRTDGDTRITSNCEQGTTTTVQ